MPTTLEHPTTGAHDKDRMHHPELDVNVMKRRAEKLHVAPKFSFFLLVKMLVDEIRHAGDKPTTGHKTVDL